MNTPAPAVRPQDRSPKYPRLTLENAIARTKMIYDQAGKAPIDPNTAAQTMNYSNASNGKAQAAFSALGQYGLLSRERKANKLAVSPLAIRIFSPIDEAQKLAALREAALKPPIFAEIHEQYGACSEAVLASHLVQKDFTREGAALAAATYKANAILAKLDTAGDEQLPKAVGTLQNAPDTGAKKTITENAVTNGNDGPLIVQPPDSALTKTADRLLAQYQIPLGANNAQLMFTGEKLEVEDFDALLEYVQIFKKQFQRKSKSAAATVEKRFPERAVTPEFPKEAVWKNKDHDQPVTITGFMGERDGVKYYQSSGGTGIPGNEIEFVPS